MKEIIHQSEGGKEACACTSTVKSKSSSPIKAFHLSAGWWCDWNSHVDEVEAEPQAKKLRCTIDVELVIMGLRLSDTQINFSQRLLKSHAVSRDQWFPINFVAG